jgi:hypothetical protein
MAALAARAAARLDTLDQDATRGPWTVTTKSDRYCGVVSTSSPDATVEELDGYGGELVGESMSSANRAFIIAMRGVAEPLAEILRDEANDWDDTEPAIPGHPLARLCRAVLGEGDDR